MKCALGHDYPDEAAACPLCGEKNPARADVITPSFGSPPAEADADSDAGEAFRRPDVPAAEPRPPSAPVTPQAAEPVLDAERPAVTPLPATPPPEALALQQALKSDLPTIAVIGSYDVGKSFFIERLDRLAFERGYSPEGVFQDTGAVAAAPSTAPIAAPNTGTVAASAGKGRAKKGAASPRPALTPQGAKVINLTHKIHLYEYTIRQGARDFRIVDIPGEYFYQLLKLDEVSQRMKLERLEETEVRKLWEVLARTDGLVLLVPATELARPSSAQDGRSELDVLAAAFQPLRKACLLLDDQLKAHGDDLAAAIASIAGMDAAERQRVIANDRSACARPLLLLLSKADEVVGAPASAANPRGRPAMRGAERADSDPAHYVERKAPGLLQQLRQGFAVFKIDFATAYGGLHADSKEPLPGYAQAGVWEAVEWVLKRTPPRRSVLRAPRRRTPAWLRESGWVLDLRRRLDPRFGRRG